MQMTTAGQNTRLGSLQFQQLHKVRRTPGKDRSNRKIRCLLISWKVWLMRYRNAHHRLGQKIRMLFEKTVNVSFSRLGIVQQLLEQIPLKVGSVHVTSDGHIALKPPPVLPSVIEFALF